jgi:hypothetical protein
VEEEEEEEEGALQKTPAIVNCLQMHPMVCWGNYRAYLMPKGKAVFLF